MSTLLRITIAAVVAIAIAALTIHSATRTDTVQRWLGREVATALGPGVTVGVVDVSLLPPPKVRLREARIETPSDQRTIVEVADLGLDIDIGELLLEREIRVTAVSVDDAVIHVDLRSERIGESLDVLAALFGGGAPAAESPDAESPPPKPRALDLPAEAKSVTVLVQPADERARPVRLDFPHLRAITRRSAGDPKLTVDLDAELAHGSLVVAIVSERREAGRAIEADFRASELTLAEIFAEPPADFRHASLEGELRREAGTSRLAGGGTLRLNDGVVSAASLGAALWKAVFGLLPGAGAAAAELVRSQPTVLESLSTRFALREHRIDLRDLQLDADDYLVTGDGSVGFDSTLSLDLQVQLTPAGLTKMLLIADLPVKQLPVNSLPPIPLRVSGTTRDPIVRATIDSLPSGILDYGTGTAEKVAKDVLDAARSVLEKGADLLDGD